METKIQWNEGDGAITAIYEGSGNGSVAISSDINEGIDRNQNITIETTEGNNPKSVDVNVKQVGLREVFLPTDSEFILADGGTFNVLKDEGGGEETKPTNNIKLTLANLGFAYNVSAVMDYAAASAIAIEVTYNGGSSWANLRTINAGSTGFSGVMCNYGAEFRVNPSEDDTYIYNLII